VSRSGGSEWAELLAELRLLRELVERQNELLVALIEGQRRMEEEIVRAGLG
jgi:hypothetical protein